MKVVAPGHPVQRIRQLVPLKRLARPLIGHLRRQHPAPLEVDLTQEQVASRSEGAVGVVADEVAELNDGVLVRPLSRQGVGEVVEDLVVLRELRVASLSGLQELDGSLLPSSALGVVGLDGLRAASEGLLTDLQLG